MKLTIELLLLAYFAWLTYQLDRQHREARVRQREMEAEWNLRRALRRIR